MRISDWSSDVCSSDLRDQTFVAENSEHQIAPRGRALRIAPRVVVRRPLDHADQQRDLLRPQLVQRLVEIEKIGRASCREGECHYVYISVVAVSSQKKKNKTRKEKQKKYKNTIT